MNADSIDHLSVFWYHLTPRGKVDLYKRADPQRSLIALAHEHGTKVFALVTNLPDDEREGGGLTWDAERVGRTLKTEKRRRAHISELIELTQWMGFDGIHIDYEGLPARYRSRFSVFIAELGEALHKEGKLLAVALHNKTSEDDPRENNGSWAQDWKALSRHADQLHIMTYNQHTPSTAPGPVASIAWVEPILRYAVEELRLPRHKVFIGLPLYAEEWRRRDGGGFAGVDVDLTFAEVQERIARHSGQEHWSSEHSSPYATYGDKDGREHVIWFENGKSSDLKLALGRRLGLCNAALWRLGGEDPDVWPLLRRTYFRPRVRAQATEGE